MVVSESPTQSPSGEETNQKQKNKGAKSVQRQKNTIRDEFWNLKIMGVVPVCRAAGKKGFLATGYTGIYSVTQGVIHHAA
jgi:hypothetical protein